MLVSMEDIVAARSRIAGWRLRDPMHRSIPLSELCGAGSFASWNRQQRTGSFKERGARNALMLLPPEQKNAARSPRPPGITHSGWPITAACWEFRLQW